MRHLVVPVQCYPPAAGTRFRRADVRGLSNKGVKYTKENFEYQRRNAKPRYLACNN